MWYPGKTPPHLQSGIFQIESNFFFLTQTVALKPDHASREGAPDPTVPSQFLGQSASFC